MLSKNTLRMYEFYHKKFLESNKDIKTYLSELEASINTLKLVKCILKYYYGKIDDLKNDNTYVNNKHAILSVNDINTIIKTTTNVKHRFLIKFMYLTGMRPSEVINLKISDINLDDKFIIIRKSKNHNNPRKILINDELKLELIKYINKNNVYLFQVSNRRMSIRGIQYAIRLAGDRVNIQHVNPLVLRHAYVTHNLSSNVKLIKQQLGHKSLGTTEIYMD